MNVEEFKDSMKDMCVKTICIVVILLTVIALLVSFYGVYYAGSNTDKTDQVKIYKVKEDCKDSPEGNTIIVITNQNNIRRMSLR